MKSVFDKWKENIKKDIDKCKTLEELKEVIDNNAEWLFEELEELKQRGGR